MARDRSAHGTLLVPFAQQLAGLGPEAWERIAERCGSLDRRTIEGFLGRAELVGRAFVFDADPYRQPFIQSALGAWGTLWGMVMETAYLFGPPDPRMASGSGGPIPKPQADALARISSVAHAQRSLHPGAAAAAFAVGVALLRATAGSQSIASLYGPFEPEIPLASLRPDPEQHAA